MSWLGRQEGMEQDLVQQRDLTYFGLPARAIVGRSIGERVLAMGDMGISAIRARQLIRRIGAGVILGTGGFVSGPGVMGAALAGRPAVILEPNVVAGAANRWLSRWATVAAVAARETGSQLRCPVEETGIPIRSEFAVGAETASLEGPLQVLVLGGSQGARQLNQLLPAAIGALALTRPGMQVTHQVGATGLDETQAAYKQQDLQGIDISLVPFLEDVPQAMRQAHLVVSRAGAITLAEICAMGRAALLLPLSLAGSHQVGNARRLVDAGCAESLASDEVTPERLAESLTRLTEDRVRLQRMGEAASSLARPRASVEIANLIEKAVGRD